MSAATTFWIIMYHHRHGTDTWPVLTTEAPLEADVIAGISEWEGDVLGDEWIEIVGPWTCPETPATSAPTKQEKD